MALFEAPSCSSDVDLVGGGGASSSRATSEDSVATVSGCGYAAYGYSQGETTVVRLSDGWSWDLPTTGCTGSLSTEWCWAEPYAVTCDELFLVGGGTTQTIGRVALDALGPGYPPD